jgi:phage tail-like protein
MPVGDRRDPYRNYHFLVEIDGIARAGFRECSGLESTQEPIDYREGNDPLTARKLPGLVKFANIVLSRGLTDDAELWAWRQKAVDGAVERKNGSVVVLDEAGQERLRWNFRSGWPTRWSGPALHAASNEIAIETLEIAHEGVTKA